jgi:homoserine dehydrogenase
LAFGRQIDVEAVPVEGIDHLESADLTYGRELGYLVKLLAIAQRREGGVSIRVRPAFISQHHPLAWVSGPFNAVSVYGHATGHTMYYGRGAGGSPTASAIVADIAAAATGAARCHFEQLAIWPDRGEKGVQLPQEAIQSRYYLRFTVEDQPGVLAQIAAILARQNISICSVLQHEPSPQAQGVPVVITTYRAQEGNIRKAIQETGALPQVKAGTICLSIVDEHEEKLD